MTTSLKKSTNNQSKYATAKIIILGDPGVGKTTLGYKLAFGNSIETTPSLQNFWVVDEFSATLDDGTVCEAVLWDLITKPDYQTIYPVFLDDVDVALILFEPSNRNPLASVKFWIDQFSHLEELPPCILVGTRIDRGSLSISKDEIEIFCEENGISGGYIETSAAVGDGLDELRGKIRRLITWNNLKEISETSTFNLIKSKVLQLREDAIKQNNIIHSRDLQSAIQTNEHIQITELEIQTSIKLIKKHGLIDVLPCSTGGIFILLEPQLLMDTAASIVNLAEKDIKGLGALSETLLLRGEFQFPNTATLDKAFQLSLVQDAIVRLISHGICFRERYGSEILLIFPGLIRQKRLPNDAILEEDKTYFVEGKVKDIYPALVVLLGYTNSLKRFHMWQNQVLYEYKNKSKQRCGFKLTEERENYVELVLHYENTPEQERQGFQGLFEHFLCQRKLKVKRFPKVICPKGHEQTRIAMIERLQKQKQSTHCNECGVEFNIPKADVIEIEKRKHSDWLQREISFAELRKTYEAYSVIAMDYWGQKSKPRYYVSYANNEEKFADKLIQDLKLVGIERINKKSDVTYGDYILVIQTNSYNVLWNSSDESFDEEKNFVASCLSKYNDYVLSIPIEESFSNTQHNISACDNLNFSDPTHYYVSLFNLILILYNLPSIPLTDFASLRQSLHEQWESTLIVSQTTKINPSKTRFDIALSFPGEYREKIEDVAENLAKVLGQDRVLYDKYFEDEFARVNLDTYLQSLYHDESELIVVFLCKEYNQKEWCGLELRAIRDLIKKKEDTSIMFMRLDQAEIPGIFSIDGYIDIASRNADDVSQLILQRLERNRKS